MRSDDKVTVLYIVVIVAIFLFVLYYAVWMPCDAMRWVPMKDVPLRCLP